jgi:hypothetical protein
MSTAVTFKEEVKPVVRLLAMRRLDPKQDIALYREAYRWLVNAPSWRRQIEAVFGTLDQAAYLTAAADPGRVDVGVFDRGELTAIIVLTIRAKGVYEVHLEAHPGMAVELLVQASLLVRDRLFDEYGAQSVFAWTPRWHRTMRRVLQAVGFVDDHVTMLHGTCHGKVIEWVRLSIEAGDDGR